MIVVGRARKSARFHKCEHQRVQDQCAKARSLLKGASASSTGLRTGHELRIHPMHTELRATRYFIFFTRF